jgi:hypothetical protein
MRLDGRCHCGYLSFEAENDPQNVSICHCTDCQTGTGSAFRVSVRTPGKSFKMLSGEPTRYVKTTAETGNPRVQAFCPKCGTPIYSTSPGGNPDSYMVRVGTLNQRDQLTAKQQNWFRSARPLGYGTRLDSARREGPCMSPIENMHWIGRRAGCDS